MIITGLSALNADTVTFTPNQTLPPLQTCSVSIDPTILDSDGVAIGSQPWDFVTGDRDEVAFRFDTPRSLISRNSPYIRKTVKQGNDIAIFWALGLDLYATVSRDGGQTFTTIGPASAAGAFGFGSTEEVDAVIRNGVIHVAWRIVPSSGEILYIRSTDFMTFSTPLLFTDPFDGRTAVYASLSLDDNGGLHIAWLEDCLLSASCNSNTLGAHTVESTDGGLSFGAITRISTQFPTMPQVSAIGSRSFVSWVDSDILQLFFYPAAGAPIASLSESGGKIWPYQLEPGSANQLFLHWPEGKVGDQRYYLARYDGQTQTLSAPRQIADTLSSGYSKLCSVITAESDSKLYWMKSAFFYGPTTASADRKLYLSTDSGDSFLYPQSLNFLGYAPIGSGGIAESECPHVLPAQNGEILLVWDRYVQDTNRQWDLMLARGTPGAPCE